MASSTAHHTISATTFQSVASKGCNVFKHTELTELSTEPLLRTISVVLVFTAVNRNLMAMLSMLLHCLDEGGARLAPCSQHHPGILAGLDI